VTLTETWLAEGSRSHLRASDADREQAVDVLKAAFVAHQMAKTEFEAGVGRALTSQTYGELAAVTASILVPPGTARAPSRQSALREQRTRRNVSEAELAEALGVGRQTLTLIEDGRYLPSLPLAFTIARFFGLTVEEMFSQGTSGPDAPRGCRTAASLSPRRYLPPADGAASSLIISLVPFMSR